MANQQPQLSESTGKIHTLHGLPLSFTEALVLMTSAGCSILSRRTPNQPPPPEHRSVFTVTFRDDVEAPPEVLSKFRTLA
jgi:hypothetical protein